MQLINEKLRKPAIGRPEAANIRQVPASWRVFKRATDIAVGTCCLVVSAPILALASLAIVAVSPGSPFYQQDRIGEGGKLFKMLKLRTMVEGAHAMRHDLMHLNEVDGPVFKIEDDPRLHGVGAFLRRTSIDELPNLFNVIRGDMSLVGPRPALPSEIEHHSEYALRRLSVPQGMTCLWQIRGRSTISFEEWMRLDNEYIDTWSPWRDLQIIAKTIPAVLRRDGAR